MHLKDDCQRTKTLNIIGFILSIIISTAVVLFSFKAWRIDFSVPISFSEDNTLAGLLVKSISENGIKGMWINPRIGAPEFSALVDTPFFDLSLGIEYLILTRVISNIYACIYVQFFLGFALCAGTMYILLNRYTKRVLIKCLLSICFSITPFHFLRGIYHQTLSNYYVIPVFLYLMDVIFCEEFQGVVPLRYKNSIFKKLVLFTSCIIVGISNLYYVFAGLIVMMLAIIGKIIARKKTHIIPELVLIIIVLIGLFIGLFPKIYYSLVHGGNLEAAIRQPLESELYGLKIIQLLLPCSYNRIGFLAELNRTYTSNAILINENESASLGLFGTIGFLLACAWVIKRILRKDQTEEHDTQRALIYSFSILVMVLFATIGGFGAIVNYFITPQIRCYNRFSIVICGLSLCVLCFSLDSALNKINGRIKQISFMSAVFVLFVIASYSEIPSSDTDSQVSMKELYHSLENYFGLIEERSDPDAMIYELPFMSFPESPPINGMSGYQPALGYLFTDHVRWSYGGMRGRNDISRNLYVNQGISYRFVSLIKEVGFSGVLIDVSGYEDSGKEVISFYNEKLGLEPIISSDENYYYFDISDCVIDQNIIVPCYDVVDRLANETNHSFDSNYIALIAGGVVADNMESTDAIWTWFTDFGLDSGDVSDREYVIFLYNNVLGRDEPNPEGWMALLERGEYTRKEILHFFLTCDEFKIVNGI